MKKNKKQKNNFFFFTLLFVCFLRAKRALRKNFGSIYFNPTTKKNMLINKRILNFNWIEYWWKNKQKKKNDEIFFYKKTKKKNLRLSTKHNVDVLVCGYRYDVVYKFDCERCDFLIWPSFTIGKQNEKKVRKTKNFTKKIKKQNSFLITKKSHFIYKPFYNWI